MTYLIESRMAAEVGTTDRIATAVRNLGVRLARYATYRRAMRELGALTDRELGDVGVRRAQIGRLAYLAANGS